MPLKFFWKIESNRLTQKSPHLVTLPPMLVETPWAEHHHQPIINHAPKKLAEGVGKQCSWPRFNVVGQGLSIFQNIEKYHITLNAQNWRCLFERALVGRALNLNFLYYYKSWLVVNYWPVLAGCVFVCVATKKTSQISDLLELIDANICLLNNCAFCHTGKKSDANTIRFFPTWYHSKNIWYHEVFLTNIYIYIIYGTIQKAVILLKCLMVGFPQPKTTVKTFNSLRPTPGTPTLKPCIHLCPCPAEGSWKLRFV